MKDTITNNSKKRVALIPSAGKGTRVEHSGSKEMLMRKSSGMPLILDAITKSNLAGARAHVISKESKHDLNSYLTSLELPDEMLSIQLINSSTEWAHTVLQSVPFWGETNLVYLPDVEFSPDSIIDQVFRSLESSGVSVSVAVFKVSQPSVWGMTSFRGNKFEDFIELAEKPYVSESEWAWGVIGFKKSFGEELLIQILESSFDHKWKTLYLKTEYLKLSSFRDLTRS
jgi:dTDP-glucose pyrophosphorylase